MSHHPLPLLLEIMASNDNNEESLDGIAQEACGICFEEGPDTGAPCGFSSARYHSRCIERLQEIQGGNFRCPHCNQHMPITSVPVNRYWLDEIGALEHMSNLLHSWISISGMWVKKPVFVRVQHGMQRGERERRVLRCVVANFVEKLKSILKPVGGVRVISYLTSDESKKMFICRDSDNTSEFYILLRRVAFIESRGRISCDGYSISGCRRRRREAPVTTTSQPHIPSVPPNFDVLRSHQ